MKVENSHQVRATISPSELQEAARLTRSKYFWLKFFAANWYSTTICVLLIGVAINGLIHGQRLQWAGMGGAFALFAFFIGLSWYRWNAGPGKAASKLSARSGTLSLDADGVKSELASGASTFVPWSSYTRWQEGKSVFVLTGKDAVTVVPIDDGTGHAIRNLLQSKMGTN